jgi:hypothetical protein
VPEKSKGVCRHAEQGFGQNFYVGSPIAVVTLCTLDHSPCVMSMVGCLENHELGLSTAHENSGVISSRVSPRLLTEWALSAVERGEALDVPARGTLWRSPDGGRQRKVHEPFGAGMRAWMLRQCHRLVPEKVVHTFSDCALHQFRTPIEVTYSLLTRDDMTYRMALVFTHCT